MNLTSDQLSQIAQYMKEHFILTERNTDKDDAAVIARDRKMRFLQNIITCVSVCMDQPISAIKSTARKGDIVMARAMYYKAAKELSSGKISLSLIGLMVEKGHCSVHSALTTLNNQIQFDRFIRQNYADIVKYYNDEFVNKLSVAS